MLMRMYLRWCERAGFKAEVVDLLPGEEAGIKSATIEVTGEYAYGYLQGETGVHRLDPHLAVRRLQPPAHQLRLGGGHARGRRRRGQRPRRRAPRGRLPLLGPGRAGGQHRRLGGAHHAPADRTSWSPARTSARSSGTATPPCASSRRGSSRSPRRSRSEELAELTGEKKEIAFGSQIRTYTFHPYQLIKDHRTGLEIGNVEAVMDGDLDPFIQAYLLWATERGRRDATPDGERADPPAPREARALRARGVDPVRRPLSGDPLGAARSQARLGRGDRGRAEGAGPGERWPAGWWPSATTARRASRTSWTRPGAIQLYARADELGDDFALFTELDVGDFVGVTGELFRTRTGELTVAVKAFDVPRQGAAAAAREVARPQGRGDALPAALRRPVVNPEVARDLPAALAASSRPSAPSSTRAASSRSRRR